MEINLRTDMISLLTADERLAELVERLKACGNYPGYYLILVEILSVKNNVIDEEFEKIFWTHGSDWKKTFLLKLSQFCPPKKQQSQVLNKYIEELSVKIL